MVLKQRASGGAGRQQASQPRLVLCASNSTERFKIAELIFTSALDTARFVVDSLADTLGVISFVGHLFECHLSLPDHIVAPRCRL